MSVVRIDCNDGLARCRCGFVVPCKSVVYHNCRSRGLGDWVKAGLAVIGITEARVSKALGRPCGCSKRAEQLNAIGRRIGIG